jgi:hypothetical protein
VRGAQSVSENQVWAILLVVVRVLVLVLGFFSLSRTTTRTSTRRNRAVLFFQTGSQIKKLETPHVVSYILTATDANLA